MTHLVTEQCIKCKYTDCVEVCPVDCFHEGPNFLVINPDECIDCGICIPECPVEAIVTDIDSNIDINFWTNVNKKAASSWPVISKKKEALPDAEQWKNVNNKIIYLQTWDGKLPFNKK